jgi:hypothetical protein
MRNNYLFLIFTFIIAFVKAPKPENIPIYNIDSYYSKEGFYEITVFKNEVFGFQFTRGRGTNCDWSHSNDTFLKESNYIRFLNSSTWDYISEEYEKELELQKEKEKNSTNQIESEFENEIEEILGGEEFYYEFFKALDGGNQPQSLYFTYSCGDDIYEKVSVNIWICDEINKEQCVEKNIIEKFCINSLTEEECTSAEAKNPKTSKCVYDNIQKVCKEEKKFCNEIKDGATEDICSNAQVSEANKICVFDNETNSCSEFLIIKNLKNDASNYKNNISLFYVLCLLLFI